jgi:hypothetical protein
MLGWMFVSYFLFGLLMYCVSAPILHTRPPRSPIASAISIGLGVILFGAFVISLFVIARRALRGQLPGARCKTDEPRGFEVLLPADRGDKQR